MFSCHRQEAGGQILEYFLGSQKWPEKLRKFARCGGRCLFRWPVDPDELSADVGNPAQCGMDPARQRDKVAVHRADNDSSMGGVGQMQTHEMPTVMGQDRSPR